MLFAEQIAIVLAFGFGLMVGHYYGHREHCKTGKGLP